MYRYRCNKRACHARTSLKHLHEWYIIKPKCPVCGNSNLYRTKDHERASKKNRCDCDGLWFPHRKGSKNCKHECRDKIRARDHEKFNQELGALALPDSDDAPF